MHCSDTKGATPLDALRQAWGRLLTSKTEQRPSGGRNAGIPVVESARDLAGRIASEFLEVFGNVGERKHAQRTARSAGAHGKSPRLSRGS